MRIITLMLLSQIRKWTKKEKAIAIGIFVLFSSVSVFLYLLSQKKEALTPVLELLSPKTTQQEASPIQKMAPVPQFMELPDGTRVRVEAKTPPVQTSPREKDMAGAPRRGLALPLAVYRDNFLGFSLRIPEGWHINATQGKILVKREPQALAGAIIYPVLLKQSMSAETFLKTCFGHYQKIYQANQGQLQLEALETQGSSTQGRFSGVLNQVPIVGTMTAKVEGRKADYRSYWAPKQDWATLQDVLQAVVESFESFQSEPLKIYQGDVFQGYYPGGWQVNETSNGIDIYDPTDQTMVSIGLLNYVAGNPNPIQWMDFNLQQAGIQNGLILRQKEYPPMQDVTGQSWKVVGREMEYDWKGRRYRAALTSGVVQQYLSFSGMISIRQAPLDRWENVAALLETIEKSFKILRPDRLGGGVKGVMLPANHPADTSSIMESWESANASKDTVAKGWAEYMQGGGYRTSEKTGQDVWVTPQDYDPTRGGYVTSNDPTDVIPDK